MTKYSARGVYQWAFAAGGTGQDWGRGIAVDTAGHVYVAGYYYSTVDFDPNNATLDDTLINAGLSDAFLLKLSQA